MPSINSINNITNPFDNPQMYRLETDITNIGYAVKQLSSKYNTYVRTASLGMDITAKKVKRIEDFLTADVQRFNSLSVRSLTAITGTIGGWDITSVDIRNSAATVMLRGAGNLAFGSTPPTSATVGTGVFIDNTGVYGLNANTQNFTLSATNGNITAIAGTVGGWTLSSTTLVGGSATLNSTGILNLGTGTDVVVLDASDATYRLAIGHSTYASAPFRVTKAGAVTATSGTVGGWTLASTTLTGGNATLANTGILTLGTGTDVAIIDAADATYRLAIGHSTYASAPFRVTKAGALTATSATITGSITGTSGSIGGWDIDATSIHSHLGTGEIHMDSGATLGTAYIAIGATHPVSSSAGTGIYMDATGLYGLQSNTKQFYVLAADGKGYFGGGNAVLSTSGIAVTGSTSTIESWLDIQTVYTGTSASPSAIYSQQLAASTGGAVGGKFLGIKSGSAAGTGLTVAGGYMSASNITSGAATFDNVSGGVFSALSTGASSTITLLEGIRATFSVNSGTVTTAYAGKFSSSVSGTAAVTNNRTVFIEPDNGATTDVALYISNTMSAAADNYSIYSLTDAQSVHVGNLRIGSAVAPTVALDVTGAALISSTLGVTDVLSALSSIELGHATDTTLARSSAGNVTIEGNLIYRAGGTDVPVSDGGTGLSTFGGTNTLLYTTTADNLSSIATANNGVLITSALGAPSISSTLPSAVQGNITALGTIALGTWNGANIGLDFGGTGKALTAVNGGIVWTDLDSMEISAAGTSGQVLQSNGAAAPTWVTTLANGVQDAITRLGTVTLGTWNGSVIGLTYGGTNKNMTAVNGGIVWTDADSMEVSAAGSSGQILRSAGAAAPTWSTATYPATAGTSGNTLVSDGTNFSSTALTHAQLSTVTADQHHAQAHGESDHTNRTRYLPLSKISGDNLVSVNRYVEFANAATTNATFAAVLPADYVSGSVTLKYLYGSTVVSNDLRVLTAVYREADGIAEGQIDTNTQTLTVSGTASVMTAVSEAVTTNPTAGDYIKVLVRRVGGDAADTNTGVMLFLGPWLEYTADM